MPFASISTGGDWGMTVTHTKSTTRVAIAGLFGITVAVALIATCVGLTGAKADTVAPESQGVEVLAITATSSVADVVEFTQTVARRWNRISVKGRSIADGKTFPFSAAVDRKTGYFVSCEGGAISGSDEDGQYFLDGRSVLRTMPPRERDSSEVIEKRNAAAALDPAVPKDGEQLLNTPVNDLICPSYWIRKELIIAAESVERVGVATVAGRSAIELRVEFPASVAKEDYWSLFIDMETGIVVGLEVEPLPGNPGYSTWIDSVLINDQVPSRALERPADVAGLN
jgi:hypothetical protein